LPSRTRRFPRRLRSTLHLVEEMTDRLPNWSPPRLFKKGTTMELIVLGVLTMPFLDLFWWLR